MRKEQSGLRVGFHISPDLVVMESGITREESFSSFEELIKKKTKEAKKENIKGGFLLGSGMALLGGISYLVGELANGRNLIYSAGVIASFLPIFMEIQGQKAFEKARLAKVQIEMAKDMKNQVAVGRPLMDSAKKQNPSMN